MTAARGLPGSLPELLHLPHKAAGVENSKEGLTSDRSGSPNCFTCHPRWQGPGASRLPLAAWQFVRSTAKPQVAGVGRAQAARRARGRRNAAQLCTTRRCCSAVSSGYIGRASTDRLAASLTGKSPSRWPRNDRHSCRCCHVDEGTKISEGR